MTFQSSGGTPTMCGVTCDASIQDSGMIAFFHPVTRPQLRLERKGSIADPGETPSVHS